MLLFASAVASLVGFVGGGLALMIGVTGLWDEWRIGTHDEVSRQDRRIYAVLSLVSPPVLIASIAYLNWLTSHA